MSNTQVTNNIKRKNIQFLFNHYIEIIQTNSTTLDSKLEHTTSVQLTELCHEGIAKYDDFFELDNDNSKVNRWLGYVQGVLITTGLLTVDGERDFTRPYLTEHRRIEDIEPKDEYPPETDKVKMFGNLKNIVGTDSQGRVLVEPKDCSLILIKHGDKFLGVSRKDDHSDIGLPGGKREYDESFQGCAVRETLEETGYKIRLLPKAPFEGHDQGLYCRTFMAEIIDDTRIPVDEAETGLVGWFEKQTFIDGSFGEYNIKMFKHFGY